MRDQTLSEKIGLALERREKVMTFEEWWEEFDDHVDSPKYRITAKLAWNHQQARIEALEHQVRYVSHEKYKEKQARIEALERLGKKLISLDVAISTTGDIEQEMILEEKFARVFADFKALLQEAEK